MYMCVRGVGGGGLVGFGYDGVSSVCMCVWGGGEGVFWVVIDPFIDKQTR